MRSDTAFFSAADISRRFLAGLASGLLSAAAAAFVREEDRRDVERAVGRTEDLLDDGQRLDLGLEAVDFVWVRLLFVEGFSRVFVGVLLANGPSSVRLARAQRPLPAFWAATPT